jgi:hypothetical protein
MSERHPESFGLKVAKVGGAIVLLAIGVIILNELAELAGWPQDAIEVVGLVIDMSVAYPMYYLARETITWITEVDADTQRYLETGLYTFWAAIALFNWTQYQTPAGEELASLTGAAFLVLALLTASEKRLAAAINGIVKSARGA